MYWENNGKNSNNENIRNCNPQYGRKGKMKTVIGEDLCANHNTSIKDT